MYKENVRRFLLQDAYFIINKHLIKLLGFNEAAVLSVLIDYHKMLDMQGRCDSDWFAIKKEELQDILNMGRYCIDGALHNLAARDLIEETKPQGVPPSKSYRINYEKIEDLFNFKSQKTTIQIAENSNSNCRYVQNNNIRTNNKNYSKEQPPVFVLPPTGDNTHTSPKGEGDGAAPEIGFPAESVGEEKVSEVSQAELEFDKFRKAYRGTKRGLATEFAYFKKSHKDWRQVLQKLTVAYEHQCALKDEARAKGCFVAQEKNLKTYIYNRGWEEELHFEPPQRKQEPSIVEKMRNIEDGYQKYREYEKQKEEQDAKEGWHSDF